MADPATVDSRIKTKRASNRHVLIMLDVQKNMLADPPMGVPNAQLMRSNIWQVLQAAREAQPPPLIVHIRNVGDAGEPDAPGTEGFELYFKTLPGEHVIDKVKNNAFTSVALGELIAEDAEIVVVGMQSDFCVRATCSSALGRGNDVLLIKGAHATYDRLEVLHGGGYTKAKQIESEIEAELEEAGVVLLDMKDVPGIFSDR